MIWGLLAATALGTSTTFWAQATTTNIRSLTAFFTALMLFAATRIANEARVKNDGQVISGTRRSLETHLGLLGLFALALGFGIGHHVSLVFIGFVLGVYVLRVAHRRRSVGVRL